LYDHIAGELIRKDLTEAVVRVGGVGYRIHIPVSTYEKLPSRGDALVYTHLVVREDEMRLYGFATLAERAFFRTLLGASRVGPASALAMMSGPSIEEFSRAIVDEDVKALSRIPGIGAKTARRISVELKDGMTAFRQQYLAGAPAADAAARDAVLALVNLGFPRPAAQKAVEAARAESRQASVEDLLRLVLARLKSD